MNVLLALGLVCSTFASASAKRAFFERPTCNMRLAVGSYGGPDEEEIDPQSDGEVGWASVIGYWVDPSRDLVIEVVPVKRADGQKEARVAFFSLCNGRQLAYGSRLLADDEEDQKSLVLTMRLRDKYQGGSPFEVQLTAVSQNNRKKKEVEVILRRPPTDEAHTGQVLDFFRVKKL